MPVHEDLLDIVDLLGMNRREAGIFCSEVAWHVSDRQITYGMILAQLDAHPRVDPSPKLVARWIMAVPAPNEDTEEADVVPLEFEPPRRPNRIQQHDFRDAQAGFARCPHGVPITQRCRICRPRD